MPKAKKPVEAPAPTGPVKQVSTTEAPAPQSEHVAISSSKQAVYKVVSASGTFIREYTVDIHGKDAEKLADQFAKKVGGKVE